MLYLWQLRGEVMHGEEEPKRKQDHIFYARNEGCANIAAASPPSRAGRFEVSYELSERCLTKETEGTCNSLAEKSLGALSRNEDTV